MKNLFVLLMLYLLIGPIYTQGTYYPLVETDKTWHVLDGGFGGFATNIYKVEGDTMINQDNFKILYHSYEEFPVNWTKHGYIREFEKRVYYSPYSEYDTVFQEPGMVYDFDVELHDTLTITSYAYNFPNELEIIISAIDTILIDDDYRRKIYYTCGDWSYDGNFWIEGIGSNNGLIEPGFYCYIVCPTIELLCVKEDENVIYHNEYYEGCYIVGLSENYILEKKFLVYPNPAKDDIFITMIGNEIDEFTFILYDLKSEVILQKNIKKYNQIRVDIANLKAGLYLYRITNNKKLLQNGKIIRQ